VLEQGVRTIRVRSGRLPIPRTMRVLKYSLLLRQFFRLWREGFRPDVIHVHVFSSGAVPAILGKLLGIPVVVTEHWSALCLGTLSAARQRLAHFVYEQADVVLPVSTVLQNCIERLGVQAEFHVVYNVADSNIFYPSNSCDTTRKRNRILTVAGMVPIKGIPYVLEAIKCLHDGGRQAYVDLVGDGPQRAEYEAISRRLGITGLVAFHGSKPKETVADFMRRADVLVLASEFETFSCVVAEALSCGLPVVGTAVGGILELLPDFAGRVVSPHDSVALAEAIAEVLDHPERYPPEAIAAYAHERFSEAAIARQLDGIYREVIAKRSGTG
jgi:glycosyltransferase involved in cell wall biosynthesis